MPVRARCLGGALNAALVGAKLVSITCLADAQTVQDLVDELPAYLVEVNRVGVSNDRKEANNLDDEAWWHGRRAKIPKWHAAALKMWLNMPSSAAVERVFSILKNLIGDQLQQSNALQDLVNGTTLISAGDSRADRRFK